MHPIDEIMEERCPNLMRNKIFWSFIKPSIYKIFKYEEAKKIVDDIIDKPGFECFTYLTEFLKAENQVTNLSNVPSSGPIILAGNHPTGLTDGIVMFDVLKKHRPDYTLYANSDMIKIAKGFQDIIIPVDWNHSNKTSEKSRVILKLTKETLNNNKALLVFPSSRLSKRKGFRLYERPWLTTITKLSKKFNVPIVPFHMDGSNSLLFYFLEIINTELKDVSLFRELINKIDFRYKIIFGEPIYPNEFDENIDKQTEIMQKYVEYELGKPPSVI
jgi:putative hemolysin